ncbi:MAG: hypothetical protein ACREJC_00185 [Tepidisphaeraceae bacterium]
MPAEPAESILTHTAPFDPGGDFDAFVKSVPARWVVYLMADEDARPVQLLCVKNLRASLKRRLGGGEMVGPTRRVDYRQIVRRIHWRRVDSAFEADVVYLEAARKYFPTTYAGMVGFRPAWFVHVNPDSQFPRWTKTIDLSISTGELFGPLEDKHSAGSLIEELVDWFDLCRYYNVLTESPYGKACAYKEMGKCPAPCDGSISMDHYRHLTAMSASALIDPQSLVREHTDRMRSASSALNFESAAKIKAFVDSLSRLGKGPLRHVRRLRDFRHISVQRGPWSGTAKVFLITPGRIDEICGILSEPKPATEIVQAAHHAAAARADGARLDEIGAERVGVVANHLFGAKSTHGVFIHLDECDDKAIAKAWRELQKQPDASATEGEGVVKELQAL